MKNLLSNLITRIFVNPKTSVIGAIIGVLTYLFTSGKIDMQTLQTILGALTSAGFFISKDPENKK